MFSSVGWSEILVLGVVALVVLGPERLPDAARWLAGAVRKVKDFAGNAQQQLKDDYGSDFDEFREPLRQLNEFRGMSPRAMVTKHLLDGDDSLFTGDFGVAAPAAGTTESGTTASGTTVSGAPSTGAPQAASTPATGSAAPAAGGATPTAGVAATPAGGTTTPPAHATGSGPVWDTDAT